MLKEKNKTVDTQATTDKKAKDYGNKTQYWQEITETRWTRTPAFNRGFKEMAVTVRNESFVQLITFVAWDREVLRTPPLLKAPNRYLQAWTMTQLQ